MSINLSPVSDDLNVSPPTPENCGSPASPSPIFPSEYTSSPALSSRISPQPDSLDIGSPLAFSPSPSPSPERASPRNSAAPAAGGGARSTSANATQEENPAKKYSEKGFRAYDRAIRFVRKANHSAAITFFSKARETLSRAQLNFTLINKPTDAWICAFNLVRIRHRVAQIHSSIQAKETATDYFTSAEERYRELLNTAPDSSWRSYCAIQLCNLIVQSKGSLEQALTVLQQHSFSEDRQMGTFVESRQKATHFRREGEILLDIGRYEEAEGKFEASLAILNALKTAQTEKDLSKREAKTRELLECCYRQF